MADSHPGSAIFFALETASLEAYTNDMEVLSGRIYLHYKGGRYFVLGVADESTNARVGGKVVVYISLTYGKMKTRDLEEFCEVIEWPNGEKKPRFVLEV